MLLVLLLLTDLGYITLHVLYRLDPTRSLSRYQIDMDNGLAEHYQYLKWAWLLVLTALAVILHRTLRLVGWVVLFLAMVATDALRLHERFGHRIARAQVLPSNGVLSAQELGELGLVALVGLPLGLGLLAGLWRAPRAIKAFTGDLLVLLGALFTVGVLLDAVGSVLPAASKASHVTQVLEDGGEMMVASVMVAFVFGWVCTGGRLRLLSRQGWWAARSGAGEQAVG